MPGFLSRLVERTFDLATVVQPVTHSIFAPEPSIKSDYRPDLAHGSESVGDQNSIYIDSSGKDSSRKTRIISQHDGQPALNLKASLNEGYTNLTEQTEEWDNQSDFTSISRQLHSIQSFKQNDSGSQEQIEYMPLRQMSEQDNPYLHTPTDEPDQENKSVYKTGSDSLKPVESEPLYVKDRNEERVLRSIPKSMISKEKFHRIEQNSQRYLEPLADSVDSPVGKILLTQGPDSILISGSSSDLKSDESILRNSEPASRADFYPSNYPHPDIQPSPIIPGRQNLKRVSTPKVNATLAQMSNMSIEQHTVASRSPSTVPSVKVTIGRIEVRAVKSPPEPQPQTPPQKQHPILSLDDYLKQYNG